MLAGCGDGGAGEDTGARTGGEPSTEAPDLLEASPGPGGGSCPPGDHPLGEGSGSQPAVMRVTSGGGSEPRALIVALHGAGGGPRDGLWVFRAAREQPGVVVLAPASAGSTWARWDDVAAIDRALETAFRRCRIDPARVAIGGFSDGATYALSLGVANGDLFGAVMALSPGGVVSESVVGQSRYFVAHGQRDEVIPVDRGGDAVVASLRELGYPVTYRKFPGGHQVPPEISAAAIRWFPAG